MLRDDSIEKARESAKTLNYPNITHFYDPNKLSGKSIANCLGWRGKVAWDIYLFYDKNIKWIEIPPYPKIWIHQLEDNWANPDHYYTGTALVDELYRATKKMMENY